jgi:hypothetical protein
VLSPQGAARYKNFQLTSWGMAYGGNRLRYQAMHKAEKQGTKGYKPAESNGCYFIVTKTVREFDSVFKFSVKHHIRHLEPHIQFDLFAYL